MIKLFYPQLFTIHCSLFSSGHIPGHVQIDYINMLDKVLPEAVAGAIERNLNYDKLYEVRLRLGAPVLVNYAGRFRHLTREGLSDEPDGAITADKKSLENIVFKASDYSLYAFNEQLKHAFITISGGIRIGIAGELVTEKGEIKTIKNFTSVNIRIPHAIPNCSLNAFRYIVTGQEIANTLIISPPGAGKTTFLRDIACQLARVKPVQNVLILDERSEIAAIGAGARLSVGPYSDVLTNAPKSFGFEEGIRSLRPDVIITDELANAADADAVSAAVASGVRVIASTHAFDHLDLSLKPHFSHIVKNRIFNRYVVLSNKRGPGTYEGIYDENFNCLYFP